MKGWREAVAYAILFTTLGLAIVASLLLLKG